MACSCGSAAHRSDYNYWGGHYSYDPGEPGNTINFPYPTGIGGSGVFSASEGDFVPGPYKNVGQADPATAFALWLESLANGIAALLGLPHQASPGSRGLHSEDGSYYPPAKANIDHFN